TLHVTAAEAGGTLRSATHVRGEHGDRRRRRGRSSGVPARRAAAGVPQRGPRRRSGGPALGGCAPLHGPTTARPGGGHLGAGATTPAEVLEFATERGVQMVGLKFVGLPGTWQHVTLPRGAIHGDDFEAGLGFDGSSIRGFQEIHESDMLLMPDSTTAFIDPCYERTTLSLICSVADPVLGEPYARDPRFVAQKAERHLIETGIADVAYFGPEAEFFVFDHIAYEQVEQRAFYEVDSSEGFWNTGAPAGTTPNQAYKLRQKEGYFPVPPSDSLANLRSEM